MIPSVKKAKMDSTYPHREGGTGTPNPRTYSTNIQQARRPGTTSIFVYASMAGPLEMRGRGPPLWGSLPPPSENLKRSNEQENV